MLENKIALVTGASRGIGREIAITLAKEGASVILNYNGSQDRAEEVKNRIESEGGKAFLCHFFAALEITDIAWIKEGFTPF